MANRKFGADRRPNEESRRIVEDGLRQGMTVADACRLAGMSRSWFNDQCQRDPGWRAVTDGIREQAAGLRKTPLPDFPEFCQQYLGMRLWDHQLDMFDVLEGREPRWKPVGLIYEPGSMGHRRVLINLPPNFAKTMTVSVAYVLWRLLKDPTLTVLVISKTRGFASKILWAIKSRLTSPRYADLQVAFGPPGGFRETADTWTQTQVYLWGDQRDSQDKDPSLEAVGIGGQIYGNRARLVVIDDAIVLSNAMQWESQQSWITQEVASRIGPDDQVVVVGTRVAPVDLYRELRNVEHYVDGEVPWTYLGMPAVLEYTESPRDWRTLWEKSDIPFSDADEADEEGLFSRWSGERLARVRNEVGPRRWALVYMQQDVEDEAIFDPVCVRGAIDGRRGAGQALEVGVPGGPDANWQPYTIVGVDPAIRGTAAFCVYTVDRVSGRRWVVDIKGIKAPTPAQIREQIIAFGTKYRPQEVRVEANAYQRAILHDEPLVRWCASNGVALKPHLTYANKTDEQYGVAAMSQLLGTKRQEGGRWLHNGDNLLSLPNQTSPGVKSLIDEMVAWNPNTPVKHLKQDHLMSMWVAELRALELVRGAARQPFALANKFATANRRGQRFTVSLSDAARVGATGRYL